MRDLAGFFDSPEELLRRNHFVDERMAPVPFPFLVGHALQPVGQPLRAWIIQRASFPAQQDSLCFREVVVVPLQRQRVGVVGRHPATHVVAEFRALQCIDRRRQQQRHQHKGIDAGPTVCQKGRGGVRRFGRVRHAFSSARIAGSDGSRELIDDAREAGFIPFAVNHSRKPAAHTSEQRGTTCEEIGH